MKATCPRKHSTFRPTLESLERLDLLSGIFATAALDNTLYSVTQDAQGTWQSAPISIQAGTESFHARDISYGVVNGMPTLFAISAVDNTLCNLITDGNGNWGLIKITSNSAGSYLPTGNFTDIAYGMVNGTPTLFGQNNTLYMVTPLSNGSWNPAQITTDDFGDITFGVVNGTPTVFGIAASDNTLYSVTPDVNGNWHDARISTGNFGDISYGSDSGGDSGGFARSFPPSSGNSRRRGLGTEVAQQFFFATSKVEGMTNPSALESGVPSRPHLVAPRAPASSFENVSEPQAGFVPHTASREHMTDHVFAAPCLGQPDWSIGSLPNRFEWSGV
jgi:hypothetical protein